MAGIAIAAPVGPVNVLCASRTLFKGRSSGLVSGLGAAAADALYGAVAAFSITFVIDFLRREEFYIRIVGGILIVFFGVYLTGLIKIPALSRERKARLTEKPLGVLGSVLVGITFAAGWTPCIGPILASILLYASTAQTVGTGILLLSVYSLGLGVPFLIASLGMNTFLAASKGIRKQLHTIEVVSGVILIVFGLALVTNVFSYFVAFLSRFLPAVG